MPYIGPEVTAPLASLLAGLMGFFLLFWRRVTGFFRSLFRRDRRGPNP